MIDPTQLKDALAALDDDFAAASADSDPFALPEPGAYQTILKAIDYFESGAGDPFLKIIYEVTFDPMYEGRSVDIIYNLGPSGSTEDRQRRLGFLKRDLTKLGIDCEADDFTLGSLHPGSPIWDQILDAPCSIAIVDSKKMNPNTGRPYRNAYLNERLGDILPSDVPSGVPPVKSVAQGNLDVDDVPF